VSDCLSFSSIDSSYVFINLCVLVLCFLMCDFGCLLPLGVRLTVIFLDSSSRVRLYDCVSGCVFLDHSRSRFRTRSRSRSICVCLYNCVSDCVFLVCVCGSGLRLPLASDDSEVLWPP
jgi:hypothetical protein